MRHRYVLGLCLTTSLTAPAAAESWFAIAATDSSIDYADADSLRSHGGVVSLDLFRGFAETSGNPVGYAKLSVEIACYDDRFRIKQSVSYDFARKYLSTDEAATPWAAFEPETLAHEAWRFACDGERGTPVLDPFADAEEYWYYYYYDYSA